MSDGAASQQTILGGSKSWPKGGNPYHDPKTGQFTSGPSSNDQPIITVTAPHGSSKPGQHWSTKDSSVKVPDRVRDKVDGVAKEFNKATGKDLVVTDGMRMPLDQAKRMFYKFKHCDFKTYKGHLGSLIAKIYRDGVKNKDDDNKITQDMADEIDRNLRLGHYVSYHLVNRAVDFSVRHLSPKEQKALHSAIKNNGGKILHESVPPHVHANFKVCNVFGGKSCRYQRGCDDRRSRRASRSRRVWRWLSNVTCKRHKRMSH